MRRRNACAAQELEEGKCKTEKKKSGGEAANEGVGSSDAELRRGMESRRSGGGKVQGRMAGR